MSANRGWLQSRAGGAETTVRVTNKSPRNIRLVWINYEGKQVWRKFNSRDGLLPNTSITIRTEVMHPWIFKDNTSGDPILHLESGQTKEILYAKALPAGQEVVVLVIPLYTLKERCIQVLRGFVKGQQVHQLELPQALKDEIARPNLHF